MSKVSLTWTMHLKTDKQGFRDAFYKVVNKKDNPFGFDSAKYAITGTVYSDISFKIFMQRKGITIGLNGTMIEGANDLLLELKIPFLYNRLAFRIKVIVFSVLLCYGIGYIPFVYDLIQPFLLLAIGIMLLLIVPVVYRVANYFRMLTSLGWKAGFMDILNEIEKQVELTKHHTIK